MRRVVSSLARAKSRAAVLATEVRAQLRPLRVMEMRGTSRGEPLSALYMGRQDNADGANAGYFGGTAEVTLIGEMPAWKAARRFGDFSRHPVDVHFLQTWPWAAGADLERDDIEITLPESLNAVAPRARDFDEYLATEVNASVRRYLRKAQTRGYSIRPAKDPDEERRFYTELMLPLATSRFAEAARLAPWENFIGWSGRSFRTEVVFLERDDEIVGGAALIIPRHDGELQLWNYGATAATIEDPERRKDLTLMLNMHAFQLGCRLGVPVSLGGTRPVMNDGVFNYKRQWGCRLLPKQHSPRFRFAIRGSDRERVLRLAPFFYLRDRGVAGVMSFRAESEDPTTELQKALKPRVFSTLLDMTVFVEGGALAEIDGAKLSESLGLKLNLRPG